MTPAERHWAPIIAEIKAAVKQRAVAALAKDKGRLYGLACALGDKPYNYWVVQSSGKVSLFVLRNRKDRVK